MYLLRLALRPWRLAPFSQLFTALAVSVLLALIGFLFWMQQGLRPVLARLENEQVLTAYIDAAVPAADEGKLVDSIRIAAGAAPEDVRLVNSEQFAKDLEGRYPELSKELEDLGSDMNTMVPKYVSVAGVLPANAAQRVKGVLGVESVDSSRDRYAHVVGAFRTLRFVAKLLAAGLCLALFTGLLHLARMNSYLHRDAISLLRLWGAGDWQLRLPGVLSGLGVGVTGGGIAAAAWMGGAIQLARQLKHLSPMLKDMPMPGLAIPIALFAAGLLFGAFAGASGGIPSSSDAGKKG